VKRGETIKRGQIIAKSGQSAGGVAATPLRDPQGIFRPVDPLQFLNGRERLAFKGHAASHIRNCHRPADRRPVSEPCDEPRCRGLPGPPLLREDDGRWCCQSAKRATQPVYIFAPGHRVGAARLLLIPFAGTRPPQPK